MRTDPALGLLELGHTRHPGTVLHPDNGTAMATTDPALTAVLVRLVDPKGSERAHDQEGMRA